VYAYRVRWCRRVQWNSHASVFYLQQQSIRHSAVTAVPSRALRRELRIHRRQSALESRQRGAYQHWLPDDRSPMIGCLRAFSHIVVISSQLIQVDGSSGDFFSPLHTVTGGTVMWVKHFWPLNSFWQTYWVQPVEFMRARVRKIYWQTDAVQGLLRKV